MSAEFWPNHEQTLLLKAAVSQGENAPHIWQKWLKITCFRQLDEGSRRLLPLVYRNLQRQNFEHDSMQKLKRAYQKSWARNQLLLFTMTSLLKQFEEAGLETLLLKGAALTQVVYKDLGLRPMSDFDVLVPTQKVDQAFQLLYELEWLPYDENPEKHIPFRHSTPFVSPRKEQIDLHWHALEECCYKDSDFDFWEAAVSFEVNGVKTKSLNSADQLLHTLVHGAHHSDEVPSFRWVADAVFIIRENRELDWQRLFLQTKKRKFVQKVSSTLTYLSENFQLTIPQEVVSELQSLKISRVEQLEHRYRTIDRSGNFTGDLPAHWFQFLRWTANANFFMKVFLLPKFFMYVWGKESVLQLFSEMVNRFFNRIKLVSARGRS